MTKTAAASVARTVVRYLADAGVRTAYTVPGESFLALLDELEAERRIRLVSTRHESGAAFMAEAEAKLTGRPALALASRGPGAANLAIGVHTAHQDQTPLLAILGQVESTVRGREAFQEVDLADFYAPLTVWSAESQKPWEVPGHVAEALAATGAPRRGPAALSVPADLWAMAYEGESPPLPARGAARPVQETVQRVAGMLRTARRPVAIAGPGNLLGRDALRRASEAHGFGVYVAFRRQDSFDEDHPHFLGHLGLGVPEGVLRGLDDADLVLVLGARLDAITSQDFHYPRPDQHLVVIGTGLPKPSTSEAVHLDVDVGTLLEALAAEPTQVDRDWQPYHDAATAYAAVTPSHAAAGSTSATGAARGVDPAVVVAALRRLAPDDVILTNDAGNFSAFLHRHWGFRTTHRLLGPCNGAMGYAVPAAVAAKLACPAQTVVAFVGDGGILMTGQEIETAVREDAPVVVLAFANGLYGTIAMHQASTHGRLAGVGIGQLDLATWARGLGAHGLVVDSETDIDAVLREALACDLPCVVDIRTDPDVIAPGRRLSALLEQSRPGEVTP
jgi:acetolactate synthase I/II/III large subunit